MVVVGSDSVPNVAQNFNLDLLFLDMAMCDNSDYVKDVYNCECVCSSVSITKKLLYLMLTLQMIYPMAVLLRSFLQDLQPAVRRHPLFPLISLICCGRFLLKEHHNQLMKVEFFIILFCISIIQ